MKRSGMYEKCNELDGYIENPYMTLTQWFITDLNYNKPLTPSIIMMRHEKK